jgi:hypothetical protein
LLELGGRGNGSGRGRAAGNPQEYGVSLEAPAPERAGLSRPRSSGRRRDRARDVLPPFRKGQPPAYATSAEARLATRSGVAPGRKRVRDRRTLGVRAGGGRSGGNDAADCGGPRALAGRTPRGRSPAGFGAGIPRARWLLREAPRDRAPTVARLARPARRGIAVCCRVAKLDTSVPRSCNQVSPELPGLAPIPSGRRACSIESRSLAFASPSPGLSVGCGFAQSSFS